MRQSLIRQQCENLPRPSHPCQCRQDQLQNIHASNAYMAMQSDRDCAASLPNDAEAAGASVAVIVSGIINARVVGDLAEHGIAAVRPAISPAAADAAPRAVVAARESGAGDIDPGAAQELVVQIADGVEVGADDARNRHSNRSCNNTPVLPDAASAFSARPKILKPFNPIATVHGVVFSLFVLLARLTRAGALFLPDELHRAHQPSLRSKVGVPVFVASGY